MTPFYLQFMIRILLFIASMIALGSCATGPQLGMMAKNELQINHADSTVNFFISNQRLAPRKLREDVTYTWYEKGRILETKFGYSGKLLDGLFTVHYKNGQLKCLGRYKLGRKVGPWKFWDTDGEIIEVHSYNRGGKLKRRQLKIIDVSSVNESNLVGTDEKKKELEMKDEKLETNGKK